MSIDDTADTVLAHPWDLCVLRDEEHHPEAEGLAVLLDHDAPSGARDLAWLSRPADLRRLLERACERPIPPCLPGRPPRIRCDDPVLATRVRAELPGVAVDVVHALPEARKVAEETRWRASPVRAPGITVAHGAWEVVLRKLAALRPWYEISEDVSFRFYGVPTLEGTVAILVGGKDGGLHLFPSERFWTVYRRARQKHLMFGWAMLFATDLPPDEAAACRQLGLVFEGGVMPTTFGLWAGMCGRLDEAEQRRLLAAIDAVVKAYHEDKPWDHELDVQSREVRSILGPVTVVSNPD